ncbi:nucleotide disphospho-sugar-binding domain-containing protein [Plantactinospora siamensis]|uniref:Nucleotide disphospho-sugar-binding domain-containing protein n=1 Tax=Plantactinospora siamensis TaxID=555372 RepID=A0ABV6P2X6_9ACTN
MRVLLVSAPLLGHVLPLVPLGRALRAAGHEVLVGTAAAATTVRDSGLDVRDIAPGFDFDRIARGLLLRHPLVARAELAGTAGTRGVALLFGAVNDRLVDGLVATARQWKPDLVLHEPLAVAGAVAAARHDVPAVRVENSLFDGSELVRVTADRLGPALRRHGLTALPPPAAAVAVAPPSVLRQHGWPMRYEPYGGEGELPVWLARPGDRPRILVSRSTVNGPGSTGLMRAVVTAAAGLDAEFVLVRPDAWAQRSSLPANVRTVGWIPLPAALPAAAAVVHHGGAGTCLAALAAGTPQLAVSGPGDRRHNAERIAARGAGLAAPTRGITPDLLRRLFGDDRLRRAAGEVAAEMAAMPAPAEVAERLAALTR